MALLKWFDNIHIYCVSWANCYILETDSSGIILAFSGFFRKSRLLCSYGRERERESVCVCVCVCVCCSQSCPTLPKDCASMVVCVCACACVRACALHSQSCPLLWTVVPLSVKFSRQEYWSRLPFLSSGNLPYPGIKPMSPASRGGFFTSGTTKEVHSMQ